MSYLFLAPALIAAVSLVQEVPPRRQAAIAITVVDAESGQAIEGVHVTAAGASGLTNRSGQLVLRVVEDPPFHLRARRLGFERKDTIVNAGDQDLLIRLIPRPLNLDPLSVRAAGEEGYQRERALFLREPVPGLVGVSQAQLRDAPLIGEADVLRALQSLSGVAATNDLSARLHVMGGAPDQNVYQLDGARVFGPYHMFGIFGSFNPDAIGRAEIFRGSMPARHGGALSSVIVLDQKASGGDGLEGTAGLGMLGARMTLNGPLPSDAGSWLLAGRRTHADLVLDRYSDRQFPYSFHDLHGHVTTRVGRRNRIRLSGFTSGDQFTHFLENVSDRLESEWENGTASLQWDWVKNGNTGTRALAWFSRYDALIAIGGGVERPTSHNDVSVGGVELSLLQRGEDRGFRLGAEAEVGRVVLDGGSEPGGLLIGSATSSLSTGALFGEGEFEYGSMRISPGARIEYFGGGRLHLAPRLFLRHHFTNDLAITLGLTRSHQVISTLRDDRFPLPGPPFWFAHDDSLPVSRSDAAVLSLDGWTGEAWSWRVAGHVRSFGNIARWRPQQERTLEAVQFDDGSGLGLTASLRKHNGRLTGWLSYQLSQVSLVDDQTQRAYIPPWNKRHALKGAAFLDVGKEATVSLQASLASGAPYWPQNGFVPLWRLDPLNGRVVDGGSRPSWSDEQDHLPAYARIDVAVRWPFRWKEVGFEPYLSLLNITGRQNVLYYDLRTDHAVPGSPTRLVPRLQLPIPMAFPSLGLDVTF